MQLSPDLLKQAFGDVYGPLNLPRGRSEQRPGIGHNNEGL